MSIVEDSSILERIADQLSGQAAAKGIRVPYVDNDMSVSELIDEATLADIPLPKDVTKKTLLNALRKWRAAAVNNLLGCDSELWTGSFRELFEGLWQWFSKSDLPYSKAIVTEAAMIVIRKAASWCRKRHDKYHSWEGRLVFSVKRMKSIQELDNHRSGAIPVLSHGDQSALVVAASETEKLSIREQSARVLQEANLTELEKQVFMACVIEKIKPQDLESRNGMTRKQIYNANRDATRKFKKYLLDLYGDQLDEIDIELIWHLQFRGDEKQAKNRSRKDNNAKVSDSPRKESRDHVSKKDFDTRIIPELAKRLEIDADEVRARLDKINRARRMNGSHDEHFD